MAKRRNRLKIHLPPFFRLSKRQKFVLATLILTFGLVATQGIDSQWRYGAVCFLAFLAFVLSVFSLREDINGIECVVLFILPIFFTAAVALFYFLLPLRLLTRFPVAVFFAIGFYALLLTVNIYNIAAIRTIALLRAARTIGFLITVITAFLLFDTIFTLHLPSIIQGLFAFIISISLLFQALWSIILSDRVEERLLFFSIGMALLIGEVAFFMAFWPVTALMGALFLTSIFYVLLGMGQRYFDQRLFRKEVYEFIIIGTSMFFLLFFSTKWGAR